MLYSTEGRRGTSSRRRGREHELLDELREAVRHDRYDVSLEEDADVLRLRHTLLPGGTRHVWRFTLNPDLEPQQRLGITSKLTRLVGDVMRSSRPGATYRVLSVAPREKR